MQKIKKDDLVKIITGKDKGKSGKVLRIDTKNHRLFVQGCNMQLKHSKPSVRNQNGGIISQEGSIDVSNVVLLVDGQPTKVGFKIEDGKKVRIAKKTGKVID